MSSRCIWRESPKTSICTFCRHRFGTARGPSYAPLQLSLFSSSRAILKPNDEAAAIAIGAASNNSGENGMPGRAFGRPSFGRASFGASATSQSKTDANGTVSARPAFGSGMIELTEDEKKMKAALEKSSEKWQPRPVTIHTGPGPQATRSGRPTPEEIKTRKEAESTTPRGRAFYQQHYGASPRNEPPPQVRNENTQSRRAEDAELRITRDTRTPAQRPADSLVRGVSSKGSSLPADMEDVPWGQLRRTRDAAPSHARMSPMQKDGQRQDGHNDGPRTSHYTPLTSAPRPFFGERSTFSIRRTRVDDDQGIQRSSNPDTATRLQPTNNPRVEEELTFAERQKLFEKAESMSRRPAASTSKSPRAVEDIPKGKGRDKAKRRQQFAQDANEDDADERVEAAFRAEEKRRRKAEKAARKAKALTPIILPEYISVANLATALRIRFEYFVQKMEQLGFEELAADHILNGENAGLIAQEYGYEPLIDRGESEDLKPRLPPENLSSMPQRPPVVTIMGHVDHGKTTLLDYLRKSSVAATEHGGITQHIGAFSVPMPSGKVITFLDTPGHAAFLNMRQRGANVTDIVILVVAADDSVKPQTIEAINHAKAANVPIVVAINKIDKEGANVDRVKQDLARHSVDIEDFGGDTQVVCVSGKTGKGIDELEETITTLSEVIDMRADIEGAAEGWVLEASIKSMGKVATVLVRCGTMRPGDVIVAGNTWARIRCLRNEAGVEIDAAGPGTPVEIDGWREQPLAGDEVLQAPSEDKAKSVVDYRIERMERDKLAEDMEAINEFRRGEQAKRAEEKRQSELDEEARDEEALLASGQPKESGPKQVYFIVKGDVSGSVEAVIDSISVLGNKEVAINIMRSGVGQLAEFDVEHAAAAKGTLINFNTTIDANIAALAEKAKVTILDHNVIYRLVDDVKATMSEFLPPLISQRVLGEADIAQIFEITVKGRQQKAIAGVKVRNGTVSKLAKVRVMRGGEKIFDGMLASLKNVKKDVAEMRKGTECGMGFEGWHDFQVGDQVQSYETKEEKRYL